MVIGRSVETSAFSSTCSQGLGRVIRRYVSDGNLIIFIAFEEEASTIGALENFEGTRENHWNVFLGWGAGLAQELWEMLPSSGQAMLPPAWRVRSIFVAF